MSLEDDKKYTEKLAWGLILKIHLVVAVMDKSSSREGLHNGLDCTLLGLKPPEDKEKPSRHVFVKSLKLSSPKRIQETKLFPLA